MISETRSKSRSRVATGRVVFHSSRSCRASTVVFSRAILRSRSRNAFNQPGPIFFNASSDVDEYGDVHRFPPEIKKDKENFPLTLIGYSNEQRMVFAELVGDRDVDEMIERVFDANDRRSRFYTHEMPRLDVLFVRSRGQNRER